MALEVALVSFEDAAAELMAIRTEVFVMEQSIPYELEIDGLDGDARQFIARIHGKAVGCARLRWVDSCWKLERVAVLKAHRACGVGTELVREVLATCEGAAIAISAQCRVVDFWEKQGFTRCGAVFDEAGIPHVSMVRR